MQIFTMYHLCQNRDDGYAPTYSQGDLLFRTITFAADPPVATDPTAARGRGSGRQAQHTRKSGLCQQQEFWEVVGVCVNNDLVASQSHDEWDWRAQNTVSYRQTADPDGVETMVTGMDVVFSFMCRKKDSLAGRARVDALPRGVDDPVGLNYNRRGMVYDDRRTWKMGTGMRQGEQKADMTGITLDQLTGTSLGLEQRIVLDRPPMLEGRDYVSRLGGRHPSPEPADLG